ncbi:MAG: outer membrane insertion C- signal [Candidatus Aminicenantes bacterium]
MKKLFATLFIVCLFAGSVYSQEIGVRFGDIVGNNVAVDFVFGSKGTRIHADVSFGDGVGIEALADLVVRPLSGEAFYYYLGFGAFSWIGDPFRLGISGELGLEYRFNSVPIAIGLDWRPSLRLISETKFFADRFGFNIRFVF